MDGFTTSLRPLPGGHSGETFLAGAAGEQSVVRIYGPRSAHRGPPAPEIDAAVLDLVRGVLPVPAVLEVRRGDPGRDLPGLLVTSLLPGERLDLLLPSLDAEARQRVGRHLGVLAGRLGHMVQPRPGIFADRTLALHELPAHLRDLPTWLAHHAPRLQGLDVAALEEVVEQAQALLDEDRHHVLVHGDLNPKNLLVDPESLEVTGVLDWEYAHAGSPWEDLGNLLRHAEDPVLAGAVLVGYRSMLPAVPDDVVDRARAADLFALVELAARPGNPVVDQARRRLQAIATCRDPGATA